MKNLPKELRIKASVMNMGEPIAFGSDTSLMYHAANKIEAMEVETKTLKDLLVSVRGDMENYLESRYWPNIHVKIDEINSLLITCNK